ncbi:hypothetical protein HGI30_04845 [Paenibacillus albicereus]|uniref:Hemerythrin-like domain-containing protein n=1 Tax=Paenibacillus albicereus TaxID=2726185 RepID=A0A6H2GU46_9BACL|nr:hypothetical protein [Paenibacillus albicereus]QJC50954.1 hypothetical protein HGI30_04845 [Paenibacillus albicereus]
MSTMALQDEWPETRTHPAPEIAVERASREQEKLQSELQALVRQTCSVRHLQEPAVLSREFRKLTSQVLQLQEDWHEHARWVETEFLPYVTWYWGEEPNLFALMDHEYGLADRCLERFHERLGHTAVPLAPEEARKLTSPLLQAYAVLKNRMLEEEELVQQLKDRSNRYDF